MCSSLEYSLPLGVLIAFSSTNSFCFISESSIIFHVQIEAMSVIFLPLYGYVALLVQANLLISSALSGFRAQRWRPTTSFCATMSPYDVVRISDKRGSKSLKKPRNRPFLLGVAVQSDLRGGSMSPRLFLQQNRARFGHLNLLHLARFLRCLARLAYLVVLLLKSPHRAFLGLTRGYLRQKEKKWLKRRICHRWLDYIYSAVASLISFFFSVSKSLVLLIFLWIRISEATPKEFLRYSKRETRWYILLVLEPFSR